MAPAAQVSSPCIFVSHETRDEVLPVGRSNRSIVPQLERAGYEVRYREFEGAHVIPPEIGSEASSAQSLATFSGVGFGVRRTT